jgi:TonB family protein
MSHVRTIAILVAACTAITFAQSSSPAPSDVPARQAQPSRPEAVRVSTGVMLGLVEHKTMPIYPDEAMKKGVQGNVVFKVEVDEAGKLASIALVEGDPLLVAASKDSLQTFRFHPYLVNGTPARVRSQLGFHFSTEKTADGASGHVECMASIPNRP